MKKDSAFTRRGFLEDTTAITARLAILGCIPATSGEAGNVSNEPPWLSPYQKPMPPCGYYLGASCESYWLAYTTRNHLPNLFLRLIEVSAKNQLTVRLQSIHDVWDQEREFVFDGQRVFEKKGVQLSFIAEMLVKYRHLIVNDGGMQIIVNAVNEVTVGDQISVSFDYVTKFLRVRGDRSETFWLYEMIFQRMGLPHFLLFELSWNHVRSLTNTYFHQQFFELAAELGAEEITE